MSMAARYWSAALLLLALWLPASAQLDGFGIRIGTCVGTPFTKPDSGATGSLGVGILRGLFGEIRLSDRWGLELGFQFVRQKGNFSTPISGDTTIIQEVIPGLFVPISTFFNGKVVGEFNNSYYQVPVLASYHAGDWRISAGGYFGLLAGGSNTGLADVVIGDSFRVDLGVPFDQSSFLNPFDYGLMAGASYRPANGLDVSLRVITGLRSIYQDDYAQVQTTVRNIYLQASIGYYLRADRKEE
jgi:hypothetical protein